MFRFLVVYLLVLTALFGNEIELKTGEEFSKGYRIVVDCKIRDSLGVVDARVYFKDKKQKIYHCFAQMKCSNGNCKGVLPVPSKYTKSVEYIILYQNSAAKIYKTEKLTIRAAEFIELPPWQKFDLKRLPLKTELLKVPKQLYGFDDKVEVQTIPLESKLGYKAGIYSSAMVGIGDEAIVDGSYAGEVDVQREIIDLKKLKREGESSSFFSSPYTWIGGALVLLILFL